MGRRTLHATGSTLLLLLTLAVPAWAQNRVTTPEQQFGHELGADYELIDYEQLHDYWIELANQSDRMVLDTIGLTEEGRPQIQAIITSPENHANIDRYREIARRLAKAEGVSEAEARALADEGKAIVWIDGGLHATEVLGAQQLTEMVYRLNDYTDAETQRILDDVIILATHANPDGMSSSRTGTCATTTRSSGARRHSGSVPEVRGPRQQPRLLHGGARRDAEHEPHLDVPRVVPADRLQPPPDGAGRYVMFAPPFRDPPNHYLDGLIITSARPGRLGHAPPLRPGRQGRHDHALRGEYSTWWNGGSGRRRTSRT
jgi:Spy/CpxP family protein refolding chaperone